jgi:hypothetical protein
MSARLSGIFLTLAMVAMTSALCDPSPPGAVDIRAFRECQATGVKKLDDGKRAEELVARDLAAHCQKAYEAMSAALLRMFGKPAWMSNYDSSMAAVQANRNPQSPLNQQGEKNH